MVSVELSEGISETLDILKHMDQAYTEKIPEKFRNFLEQNKSANYIPHLDHSKKMNEMKLKEKTRHILAVIYMNYWCSPEEKSNYVKLLNENEIAYQKELREKYNPDKIFEKRTSKLN